MKKTTFALTATVLALTSASFVAGLAVAKGAAKMPVLSSARGREVDSAHEGGAAAGVRADRGRRDEGRALRLSQAARPGSPARSHSHSSDYWAVLVQGKMTHWAADGGSEAEAKPLGVGDLTFMPAKIDHISKCFPGAECVMAIYQKGKFDFIPAKEAKAAKDAKAKDAKPEAKEAAAKEPAKPAAK